MGRAVLRGCSDEPDDRARVPMPPTAYTNRHSVKGSLHSGGGRAVSCPLAAGAV